MVLGVDPSELVGHPLGKDHAEPEYAWWDVHGLNVGGGLLSPALCDSRCGGPVRASGTGRQADGRTTGTR